MLEHTSLSYTSKNQEKSHMGPKFADGRKFKHTTETDKIGNSKNRKISTTGRVGFQERSTKINRPLTKSSKNERRPEASVAQWVKDLPSAQVMIPS